MKKNKEKVNVLLDFGVFFLINNIVLNFFSKFECLNINCLIKNSVGPHIGNASNI